MHVQQRASETMLEWIDALDDLDALDAPEVAPDVSQKSPSADSSAAAPETTPAQVFCGQEGVTERILWQSPDGLSCAGLLELAPGACVPTHWHPGSSHHRWVVTGTCRLSGRPAAPGSYEFVEPGAEHSIEEAGPSGCTLFFVSTS